MELHIHFHAEQDLNRLSELDEDAIGYLDNAISLSESNSILFDGLCNERYFQEYSPPHGPLGLETKPILSLCKQKIKVGRIRFDDPEVSNYRIIYSICIEKQPNGTFIRRINILAVINKKLDKFHYQPQHPITQRIMTDYEELHSN